ncbi:MAG: hypothetical protein ACRD2R_00840 [Terriglobales bacterium]
MKKPLVAIALALAVVATAGGSTAWAQEASGPQPKIIKDPAEHNTYTDAISQEDANARISALEGFLIQYPNSVVKEDGLLALMGAYFQTQNSAKAMDTASRILQVNPSNLRALVVLVSLKTGAAEANQNPQQNLQEAKQLAEQGLDALETTTRREGESQHDLDTLKNQAGIIFHGTLGWAALGAKDYAAAQEHLLASVIASPDNLKEVYRLALAFLESNPVNPRGLWFIARAVNLSGNNKDIARYGRSKYVIYHGGEDGWSELLAQTRSAGLPPADFAVKPAPTPIEQAAQMVASKKVREMNMAEIEFILSIGGAPAEKVWSEIKGVPLAFQGKVIGATRTALRLAATVDAIEANRADVELTMAAQLPIRMVPQVGSNINVQGEPAEHELKPFLMKMQNGVLITSGAGPRRVTR